MWILPKQIQSLTSVSVLDTKESEKDLEEFCQMSEKSLMWRSKPSLLRTWLARWKRNNWMQHLSIRTLKSSHTKSFVEKWTSYLEDSLANHSLKLELEKLQRTQDTSFLTSQKELESANQELFSSKMSKELSQQKPQMENQFSDMSSEHWKDWVTKQRLEYSQRVKSASHIREKEFTSLAYPTPSVAGCVEGGVAKNVEMNEKGFSAKTTDGESVLRYVLRTLEGLGYKATAGIFSASEVGFPHQRKRVYILGVSDTISSGLRGGRSSEECRDEREGILSNEGERNEVRSETEGCSNTSSILGYSEGTRQSSSDDGSRQAQLRGTSSRNAQSELSHTDIERLEGSVFKGEPREQTEESSSGCSRGKYPARPNEEQYEWEAPRVVEAKPRLGGATYGSSNRVDRLRLLGNGVVPQTAAKAFETLIKRIL